ncbi:GLPGLI family protein [Spirosoma sp. BT702]|uniref:GLPGLI family protein n=1 Tax=Spirosoma profusum TaxID=2771354 RepID=A0A927APY6_9BACT|nr:GLPGLI family protein [Spirosoma profusum]MBD2699328.1 GLPGLI family protein [Spirosoma profusum]
MKQVIVACLLAGLFSASALAQTSVSGKITYEGMRQIDRSQMRMVINGQEVRPGSPGAPEPPEGMPDVISFTQKLVFSGTMAKEETDRPGGNMMFRRQMDGGQGGSGGQGNRPREMRMTPPFEQQSYLDLANRQRIDVMTITKDSVKQTYRSEHTLPKSEGWQLSDKTKKIAGYVCHKATVAYTPQRRMNRERNGNNGGNADANAQAQAPQAAAENYTIWYTTDLPFTYSPVAALTPEKGVVLQIESDSQSFKATNVAMEAIDEAAVQPPKDAKAVSEDEMNQLRRRAMADFRQKMMQNSPFPRN